MKHLDLPQPTRDFTRGCEDLKRFGYAIHADVLAPDQLRRAKARLQEQAQAELDADLGMFGLEGYIDTRYRPTPADRFAACPAGVPPYQQVPFLVNKGREFLDLLSIDLLHRYVREILCGVPYALATLTGLLVSKGACQQIIHVDQQPLPFATPMPTGLNIMLCLTDFEEDMGATRMVPGSHLGPPPKFVTDEVTGLLRLSEPVDTVPAVAPAGSAILFESRVWHGQGPATSAHTRLSIGTNYVMHFLKPQDNYPASLHDDVYATLNEHEQRMLGFDAVFAYGGRLAPRSAEDRRRNLGSAHPWVGRLPR